MYAKHFGLTSRPFGSGSDLSGIFVGPAQAKIIANVNKALAASDAVITVTGPVGVGKTTVVNRALEGVVNKRVVARVGRMQLAADEVLELLLTEFKLGQQPAGTIQRFAAFRQQLTDWAAAGTRAFVIVEDAERIGTDALIELEAITAADGGNGGDGSGASVLLMGQPTLADLLTVPALARLRQRIRQRQTATAFSAAEVRGYLKHCIRNAGGDFDRIFDPGAVDMLHRCSEGIPRIINNLCEAVLVAAADANAPLVMPQLVQHVAHEEFGLDPSMRAPALTQPEITSDAGKPSQDNPPATPARAPDRALLPTAPARPVEAKTVQADKPDFEPFPVGAFTAEPEHKRSVLPRRTPLAETESIKLLDTGTLKRIKLPGEDEPLPELIQDTLPGLTALKVEDDLPDLSDLIVPPRTGPTATKPTGPGTRPNASSGTRADQVAAKSPVPPMSTVKGDPAADWTDSSLPILDDIPTLMPESKIEKRQPPTPAAASDKSLPTPDNKPLATSPSSDTPDVDIPEANKDTTITEIPDWDRNPALAELETDFAAIEAAFSEQSDAPVDTGMTSTFKAIDEPAAPAKKTPAQPKVFDLPEITLEKKLQAAACIAQQPETKSDRRSAADPKPGVMGKAKTGLDIERIAVELGKARSLEDVDDKLAETLFGEEMANASAGVAALLVADEAARLQAEKDERPAAIVAPPKSSAAAANAAQPATREQPRAPVQRAASVKPAPGAVAKSTTPAIQADPIEITLETETKRKSELPAAESTPEPIEDQFGTSMTATLKALSAAQVQRMEESANDEDDEDAEQEDEKPARRLFGLFRGSS